MSEKKIPRPNQKADYLTFLVGEKKEKVRVKMKDKGIIIGRSTKSKAVDLDTKPYDGDILGVSRQHLLIAPKKDYFYVQDLESVNSTWLNRVRMSPMIADELYHGDVLHLGECRIEVYYTYEEEVHEGLGTTKAFEEETLIPQKSDDVSADETYIFGEEKPWNPSKGKTGVLSDIPTPSKDDESSGS